MAQVVVGVDDGYAQVKVFGKGIQVVASATVRGGAHVTSMDGSSAGVFETEGKRFTAGDSLGGEETRFDGYHTSDLNRIAVHNGLHLAGLGGKEVSLVLGLPVRDFFRAGAVNKELIAAKKASFLKPVARIGGPAVTVAKVQVLPQAVSALVDWGHDAKGGRLQGVQGLVGIVDIGGRTTDVAVVEVGIGDDMRIHHDKTGTINKGVLDAVALIGDGLRVKFDVSDELPRSIAEQAIRTGAVQLFGKEHQVGDLVQGAVNEVGDQIQRAVTRFLGQGAMLSKILFVGGGAAVFHRVVGSFGDHAEIVREPEFANARGMYKFAIAG